MNKILRFFGLITIKEYEAITKILIERNREFGKENLSLAKRISKTESYLKSVKPSNLWIKHHKKVLELLK